VQAVIAELGNEKIDVIAYSDDPAKFVAAALSPASVDKVSADENDKTAYVEVPDDQLSLAIGKDGQNVRLAAKLTNWRVDIKGAEKLQEKSEKKEEKPSSKSKTKEKEKPKKTKEKKTKLAKKGKAVSKKSSDKKKKS
jgi:N utilization substance protein A